MGKILYHDWGRTGYMDAWDRQKLLFQEIIDRKLAEKKGEIDTFSHTKGKDNHLVFTEHNHVYTLGKSGKKEHLLLNEAQMEKHGVEFVHTNRGGDITYHGPEQIVGYPILDLEAFKPDIRWYMRSLEEVIIRTLAEYDIKAERSEGETGVWLDVGTPFARKICAMGVRTSRWVTMHGFALNVNVDLGYFDHIIPCGIRGKAVTSMEAELMKKIDVEAVKGRLKFHFEEVFESLLTRA